VAAVDSNGQTIWIADAHRGDGKRFVVTADEKLTAFVELEAAVRAGGSLERISRFGSGGQSRNPSPTIETKVV
jgi:hypothetical protein